MQGLGFGLAKDGWTSVESAATNNAILWNEQMPSYTQDIILRATNRCPSVRAVSVHEAGMPASLQFTERSERKVQQHYNTPCALALIRDRSLCSIDTTDRNSPQTTRLFNDKQKLNDTVVAMVSNHSPTC